MNDDMKRKLSLLESDLDRAEEELSKCQARVKQSEAAADEFER